MILSRNSRYTLWTATCLVTAVALTGGFLNPPSAAAAIPTIATSTTARTASATAATAATAQIAAADIPCAPGANAVVCENTQPGVDPSVWDIDGAGDPSIQGFSTDISANVGSPISFKIDTPANYTIEIYRTGWYNGLGARKIADVMPLRQPQPAQPQCITDSATEVFDCGTWSVSATWNVPATAVSGVYVARLSRTDTGGASHITFIVRNDASQSDVVFQTSDPSWQAYKLYGGSDFYQGAGN
ncbi:MAG: hypothetical protein JWM51_2014, partial [Microbacteriaceae bacterium]|nr:hypothetical protein [Microbacteriaceae bacterium]